MHRPLLIWGVLVAGASVVSAQDVSLPSTFHCEFEASDGHILTAELTNSVKMAPIHDLIVTEIGVTDALQILPGGETPVSVVRSNSTMHFLTILPNGSLNVMTVFLNTRKEIDGGGYSYPLFRAVMSRHAATLRGEAEISQFHGSCRGAR